MKEFSKVLAFDFGASSGRAILGEFDGERITLNEIHRFSNDPVIMNGTMYWDVLRLFFEIKQGLLAAKPYGEIHSIGIDTWGVDFGLLDEEGKLIENPVHYRDLRTSGMLEKAFEKFPKDRFYEITGNQFMEINTAFQLFSLSQNRPQILERAKSLLMMPDLFNYFLTNVKSCECSIASTSQLMDAKEGVWSKEIMTALQIPERLFSYIVPSGAKIGKLSKDICEELSIEPADVIAVSGHDTQSAIVSVPAQEDDFAFLSCGTWSLLGTELCEPLINQKTLEFNITNECGYGNKTSFLKNITGLWLIQETRRQWKREGMDISFAEMEKLARGAMPFRCYIDPDFAAFSTSGDIAKRIQKYCVETNQSVPLTKGEILRCIYESLAMKYRFALSQMEECTGKKYEKIYLVGGGTKDKFLCQMTANACGCNVSAGPVEATVLGNIAVQLMASGKIANINEARKIIKNSQSVEVFEPQDIDAWQTEYNKFLKVTKC